MSDRFDDLLPGVVDAAARAAREPGAAAARKRGRERRTRRRLAGGALSLALLGVISGVAAVSVHGPDALPAAHASDTALATASPTTPSPTPTGPSTATQSTVTPGAPVTAPNPDSYVAGAWLSASHMPLELPGYTDWQPVTNAEGIRVGGAVFATTPGQTPISCMDIGMGRISSLTNGLEGGQVQRFSSPNNDKIRTDGTIPAYTDQAVLLYPTTADADAAMNGLAASFATCKNQVTATDPTTGNQLTGTIERTANQSDAQCWSVLALTASGPGILDHDCFVHSGTTIEEVSIEINEVPSFSTQNFTATDTTLIPALQHDLQQY
jgi:hypothetical protein